DNAMLYDEGQFQPLAVQHLAVDLLDDKTRNILYVKGISKKTKGDTLHIFVNHWPSRSEGQETSEWKRCKAADVLKNVTDSIFSPNNQALIVIMGDMNDEPLNASVSVVLKAYSLTSEIDETGLYNLMSHLFMEGKGTLYYKDWDLFDQIIISGGFWLKQKGLRYSGSSGNIFSPDYLLFTNKEGVSRPNRTAAKDYYGGYSDHLPVYIDLLIKK
ncbi:MAG TPA: hypothetical protein PKM34_05265, partial [Bacteroidales bacterium]|nr:hypothetical protein [Bacteroidales bacterium]